jgi:outer membrane protein assembly factor BamB
MKPDFRGLSPPATVGDTSLSYPPVIANGYVYVASAANVYAVKVATHQQVWTASGGGWLALAERRLIVAGSTQLTAYLLKY